MPLTPEKYERLKSLVDSGSDAMSAAVRQRALAAIAEYESQGAEPEAGELPPAVAEKQARDDSFLAKGVGADQAPLAPGEKLRVIGQPAAPITQDSLTQDLMRRLDPSLPLQPQALAIQPSTTHPGGDKAAADEWVRGELDNPAGKVIVYDAPAATVRQKILENPQLLKALGYDMPLTPDAVMGIEPGDDIYQAYNDYEWRKTAEAATAAGKTAYRYAKAPWLKSGGGASVLDTLSTKLQSSALPGLEAVTAFVIGADNTGSFGAATSAREAGLMDDAAPPLTEEQKERGDTYHPTLGAVPKELKSKEEAIPGTVPVGSGKSAVAGGVTASSTLDQNTNREQTDMLREENPGAHLAGQVYGAVPGAATWAAKGVAKAAGAVSKTAGEAGEAVVRRLDQLAHWNLANQLWNSIVGGAASSKVPAVITGAGSAAAAAGAHSVVSDAVRAGANLVGEGEAGVTAQGTAQRALKAAEHGAYAALPFAAVQGVARGTANWVRDGKRFEGIPRRLENNDVDFKFGRGPVPGPLIKGVRQEAAVRDVKPVDVVAERIEKPLTDAAKGNTQDVKVWAKGRQDEVYASREGKQLLPAENVTSTAISLLRKRMASIRGKKPTAVGTPNAQNPVRGIFNANIDAVSLRPVKGAIPLRVEEAEAFLNPVWQQRALKAQSGGGSAGTAYRGKKVASVAGAREAAQREGAIEAVPELRGPSRQLANEEGALAPLPELRGPKRQLEGPRGIVRAARPGERRGPDALPEGRGELSTNVDTFPHMRDPRDIPPPAGFDARDVASVAPKARQGARWRRREPEVVEGEPVTRGAAEPKGKAPKAARVARERAGKPAAAGGKEASPSEPRRSFGEELRSRGVRMVYVVPRRYNAQHHESAIQLLRKAKDTTAKDRDLVQIYNAALKDRDARTWQGQPGGWSALQREHEQAIGQAKDIQKRVVPQTGGAYRATVKVAKQRESQSKDLDAMTKMAERAGVNRELKAARALDPLEKLEQRISFGKDPRGGALSPLSPNAWSDAAVIKGIYPVARQLENPLNPLAGGQVARATLLGEDDRTENRRRGRDERASKEYRAAYDKETGGGTKKTRRRKVEKKVRKKK